MLVIPVPGKIQWKNPPYLTLLLVLANCFVFVLFQLADNERFYRAAEFYVSSGLAAIEAPVYVAYVNSQPGREKTYPDPPPAVESGAAKQADEAKKERIAYFAALFWDILEDAAFLKQLRSGEIITREHPAYENWAVLRGTVDDKLAAVVTYSHGFKPAFPTFFSALSHMFLHGGVGHLVGNMIFLWLAGCLVELGMKRAFFLPAYVLTGISSVCLFWAFNTDIGTPLVGASGAISGVMGMLATLYGKNRISVFYSLGFYFNYIKVPALIVLPVWIGKELVSQFLWAETSNVAYLAHVGGFIGGAAIGLLSRSVLHIDRKEKIETPPEDRSAVFIEEALEAAARLDLSEAFAVLDRALREYPGNIEIMKAQYKVARMRPEEKQYHAIAIQLLKTAAGRREHHGLAQQIYRDYTGLVKTSHLSARTYVRMTNVFIAAGDTDQAEKIINILLKHKKEMPELPSTLLKLAETFKTQGQAKKHSEYCQIILSQYPDSAEAALINGDLSGKGG